MREGNVLTSVCQEFCPRGGGMHATHAPQACMPTLGTYAPCRYYEMRSASRQYASYWNAILLPSTMKLQRLCFNTCLSVILFMGGSASVHAGIPAPRPDTPRPGTPLGPGTPPGTRHPSGTRHLPPCRRLLLRTLRILLECILVHKVFLLDSSRLGKCRDETSELKQKRGKMLLFQKMTERSNNGCIMS